MIAPPVGPDRTTKWRLTPAERLVAAHVVQGLSNKEIATALGKAESTVKHQLTSAMGKLGVQSRCQLIVRILRHGAVSPLEDSATSRHFADGAGIRRARS